MLNFFSTIVTTTPIIVSAKSMTIQPSNQRIKHLHLPILAQKYNIPSPPLAFLPLSKNPFLLHQIPIHPQITYSLELPLLSPFGMKAVPYGVELVVC
jgi:hypothetical protein